MPTSGVFPSTEGNGTLPASMACFTPSLPAERSPQLNRRADRLEQGDASYQSAMKNFYFYLCGLALLSGSVTRSCAEELKAFSLREANRLLAAGQSRNEELQTLGGITRFAGMVLDREKQDIILIGKVRVDLPPASIDDLAVALRCRLLRGGCPRVSIDMVEETARTGMQNVRFDGGIDRTAFGSNFLGSDVILKRYSLGLLEEIGGRDPVFEALRKRHQNAVGQGRKGR